MKKLIILSAFAILASIVPVQAVNLPKLLTQQEEPKKKDEKKDKKDKKKKKHHGEGHDINKRHNKKPK